MQVLPPALAPMGAYRQFILYKLVPDGAKTAKKPVNPHTLKVHNPHDPEAWVSFDDAAALLPALGAEYGIGFVFTAADPFWFLDIDGALVDGEWSAVAHQACSELAGAAIEVSSSGRGLHLFGQGFVPPHGSRNATLHTELYTEGRFVALTGLSTVGDAGFVSAAIGPYAMRHFPVPTGGQGGIDAGWWSEEPVSEWRGPTDDDQLIERALKSRSAASVFGGKACFSDLWHADEAVLGECFPADRQGDSYNASTADAALAQHLCFWTGNNAERIDTLMRNSGLARPKYDDRDDYLPRTIRKACSLQSEWLCDAPPATSPFAPEVQRAPVVTEAMAITTSTFIGCDELPQFFAGCVYVIDEDKFMLPTGMRVDASRFNRVLGGHTFILDKGNVRPTRKASEAFTENEAYRFPRVDTTCFRPLEAAGAIVLEGGQSMVNTWVPVETPREIGDIGRFTEHLAKMLPEPEDQRILLYYMAACVQMQGRKFQWAPLIQGSTGNGKSMLSQFVRKAIGKRYCHTARADNLGNNFNAWMAGRTFYSVDEIYIPDKRLNLLETLKEMITGDEQEVTPKGIDAATKDICGNFMFFTNHLDGIKKNRHERRIAPFYTAQQQPADLIRDGMTEDYFKDLVDWCKGQRKYAGQTPGYSIISGLLWSVTIPEKYDPSISPRAPITSSTEAAIDASRSPAEQEILEAIAQEETGFKGGWVSSIYVKRLMATCGLRIPPNTQGSVVEGLGFVPHPALASGRVNNKVEPDNGKPRLFVHETNAALLALMSAADVARHYSAAQLV